MFRNGRSRSRVAMAMLVVWLFALASSWANACVLENRQTHLHASASASEPRVMTVMAGHAGAVSAHGGEVAAGTAVCLEVCDAVSQTSVSPDGVIDLPAPVLGPPVSLAWMPDVAVHVADRKAAGAPLPRTTVPPRTLLSRLAL